MFSFENENGKNEYGIWIMYCFMFNIETFAQKNPITLQQKNSKFDQVIEQSLTRFLMGNSSTLSSLEVDKYFNDINEFRVLVKYSTCSMFMKFV